MTELTRRYFAYGNNMHPETMEKRIGDESQYRYIGRARLMHYRLSFTTRTPEWDDEPVSDVSPAERFAVYGVLYQMTEEAFAKLAPHEPTYERSARMVDLFAEDCEFQDNNEEPHDSGPESAEIYAVRAQDKEPEGVPHDPYLKRIIQAASIRKLPPRYIQALRSLAGLSDASDNRLVALPTESRGQGMPYPIVQVSPRRKLKMNLASYAMVTYGKRTCLAEVKAVERLERLGRVCGVDENLRIRLGMPSIEPGVELYGACVALSHASRVDAPRQLLRPRCLLLSLDRTASLDAEKDICAIDKSILDLLGGEPGDKLQISSFSAKSGRKTISRRAMCGATGRWDYLPKDYSYPAMGSVHLDAEDRSLLGFKALEREYRDSVEGQPLLVSVDIMHQIKKRIVVYLLSLMSTILGTSAAALSIGKMWIGENAIVANVEAILFCTVLTSLAIVSVIIHLDISSRVQP